MSVDLVSARPAKSGKKVPAPVPVAKLMKAIQKRAGGGAVVVKLSNDTFYAHVYPSVEQATQSVVASIKSSGINPSLEGFTAAQQAAETAALAWGRGKTPEEALHILNLGKW